MTYRHARPLRTLLRENGLRAMARADKRRYVETGGTEWIENMTDEL